MPLADSCGFAPSMTESPMAVTRPETVPPTLGGAVGLVVAVFGLAVVLVVRLAVVAGAAVVGGSVVVVVVVVTVVVVVGEVDVEELVVAALVTAADRGRSPCGRRAGRARGEDEQRQGDQDESHSGATARATEEQVLAGHGPHVGMGGRRP